MIKIVGAILILFATTWTGFEVAKQLTERPRQLRALKTALQSLEAEIMYGHTPLHEAARRLSQQLPSPINGFFNKFGNKLNSSETTVRDAWEESLKEIWGKTALKKGEFEIMKQFGETLRSTRSGLPAEANYAHPYPSGERGKRSKGQANQI